MRTNNRHLETFWRKFFEEVIGRLIDYKKNHWFQHSFKLFDSDFFTFLDIFVGAFTAFISGRTVKNQMAGS